MPLSREQNDALKECETANGLLIHAVNRLIRAFTPIPRDDTEGLPPSATVSEGATPEGTRSADLPAAGGAETNVAGATMEHTARPVAPNYRNIGRRTGLKGNGK